MPKPTLASDVRIADILHALDDPEEYVRGVLSNMTPVKRQRGGARMCIGTTGRGVAPHYRIEPSAEDLDIENIGAYYVAFHGRSHERLSWGQDELKDAHWSTAWLSYGDVQSLLGELRQYKGRK